MSFGLRIHLGQKLSFFLGYFFRVAGLLGIYLCVQLADEKTPDNAPPAVEEQIRKKEAERILKNIDERAHVCVLAIKGKRYTSEAFSEYISSLGVSGTSHIQFVIGGSLGLHESVLKRADSSISFSDMTFPHQMMRVILLEQIYRGYKIFCGEPYHK
ncbi:MAG: 23S rRNA (pseudouridine(1915)-N(3))-methyltransferase RlmH [Butyrivibrio sp.]|nr:23S rRNA (pseudouridine(1915)-N(3))-methyltransferase RlmH [Butyrivibrio sp.]